MTARTVGLGALTGLVAALLLEALAASGSTGWHGAWGVAAFVGEPLGLIAGAAIGILAGAIVLAAQLGECLTATIARLQLTLAWDDVRLGVPRELITGIVTGTDLVVLGRGGLELARVPNTLDQRRLRAGLVALGFPTPEDDDPNDRSFVPWRATDPAICADTHRFLAARANATRARAHSDAEHLRRALAARGVIVRDVGAGRSATQQWRTLTTTPRREAQIVTAFPGAHRDDRQLLTAS